MNTVELNVTGILESYQFCRNELMFKLRLKFCDYMIYRIKKTIMLYKVKR